MKTITRMLWLLLGLSAASSALAGELKVKTAVEKVTLFIDGAQITRTKEIDLPAGNTTVVFTGLSPYLDDKSMQVSAKGKFTVTGVNRLFNHRDSLERSTRQKALEQQLEQLEQEMKKLLSARELIEAEAELLKVNCSAGNRNVATPLSAIRELNEYYVARMDELNRKTFALNEQGKKLNEREQQLRAELAELGGKQSEPTSEIEVRIEAPAAGKASFTLTYYVRNAGWFPSYDVRSEGLSKPVTISYKANIFQNTKEEWKNVELTLSSSNPNTGNIAPQLRTWWLDYGLAAPRYDTGTTNNSVSGVVLDAEREPIAGASVLIPGSTVGTSTDVQGRYSLTIPNGARELQFNFIGFESQTRPITGSTLNVVMKPSTTRLEDVVVVAYGTANKAARTGSASATRIRGMSSAQPELSVAEESMVMDVEQTQNLLGYEFEIKQPYTVHSDGKAVTAEIGRFDLPALYTYRSTPKIDKDAFLVAEATGWEKLNLLQGEANVYFENTFVGKSILDPVQEGDTLRFSMGRDQGLRIERTKETDYTSRRTIGSNQTQTIAWKFTVRNTRTEPVVVSLADQLPVSRNSTITVTEEELSGGQLDKESGLVTWRLELQPGEQRELKLRYGVKYPKGQGLTVE